jgi:hypothetical protein
VLQLLGNPNAGYSLITRDNIVIENRIRCVLLLIEPCALRAFKCEALCRITVKLCSAKLLNHYALETWGGGIMDKGAGGRYSVSGCISQASHSTNCSTIIDHPQNGHCRVNSFDTDRIIKQLNELNNGVFWDVTPCGSCKKYFVAACVGC